LIGLPRYSPEPGACTTRRRIAIGEADADIQDARSLVDRQELDARTLRIGKAIDRNHSACAAGMLNNVGGHFHGDDGDPPTLCFITTRPARELAGDPPRFSDMAWVNNLRNHISANELGSQLSHYQALI
jgi:hypothetical protein